LNIGFGFGMRVLENMGLVDVGQRYVILLADGGVFILG